MLSPICMRSLATIGYEWKSLSRSKIWWQQHQQEQHTNVVLVLVPMHLLCLIIWLSQLVIGQLCHAVLRTCRWIQPVRTRVHCRHRRSGTELYRLWPTRPSWWHCRFGPAVARRTNLRSLSSQHFHGFRLAVLSLLASLETAIYRRWKKR